MDLSNLHLLTLQEEEDSSYDWSSVIRINTAIRDISAILIFK